MSEEVAVPSTSNINDAEISFNPYGVLIALTKLFRIKFEDAGFNKEVQASSEIEDELAEKLFEAFSEIIEDYEPEIDDALNFENFVENNDELDESFLHELISVQDSDESDEEFIPPDENKPMPAKKPKISMERKKEIYDLAKQHPNWKWTSFKSKGAAEVTSPSSLRNIKQSVERGLGRDAKFRMIQDHVINEVMEARKTHKILRSSHLRQWGMQKFLEIRDSSLKFKASKSWVTAFKKRHRISSRKVTKLVSKREIKTEEEILKSAKAFQTEIKSLTTHYDPSLILNTDQCGFNYEMLSKRTLTFKGEKTVLGYAQSPTNLATHSLTVQYIISMAGKIVGNAFLCLQEPKGKLGPRVKSQVEAYLPPNITLTCSTSGKMSTSLNEYFIEKQLVPSIKHGKQNFLYIIDSWSGHTNINSYNKFFGAANEMPEILIKVIPEKCTPYAQPLDTTFHRQLKVLAREILAGLEVFEGSVEVNPEENWTSRKGVIQLQSLLHFLLSAPIFQPMIKYAWYSSGLSDEKVTFENAKQVCFTFTDDESLLCSIDSCDRQRFIKCSNCRKLLCLHHLWFENHFYTCECNPC